MSPTKAYAINFASYIQERTADFTGREWVFRRIDTWLRQKDAARIFLLTGEPGSGKTAIAARLAQFAAGQPDPPAGCEMLKPHFLSAVHFCRATASGQSQDALDEVRQALDRLPPRGFAHPVVRSAGQQSRSDDYYTRRYKLYAHINGKDRRLLASVV